MRPPLPRFRPLVAADQDRLWQWLHVTLWDPPPAPLRPVEILQSLAVRINVEGWGRKTDCGVVAVVDGVDAGACLMRVLPAGAGSASGSRFYNLHRRQTTLGNAIVMSDESPLAIAEANDTVDLFTEPGQARDRSPSATVS